MKLVLASNNGKKLKELDAILAPLGWQLVPQGQLGVAEALPKPMSHTAPSSRMPSPRPVMHRG